MYLDKIIYICLKLYNKYFLSKIEQQKTKLILESIKNKGIKCQIKWNSKIYDREQLILGDYVNIGENAHLFCKGGLKIGNNTQISRNVIIYTANHNIESSYIPYDASYIEKPVEIGESVWIGINVMITPGVKIGDGAVIGMGTVISKNVPAGAIVVGAEQRIVKYRNMNKFDYNNKLKNWYGIEYE